MLFGLATALPVTPVILANRVDPPALHEGVRRGDGQSRGGRHGGSLMRRLLSTLVLLLLCVGIPHPSHAETPVEREVTIRFPNAPGPVQAVAATIMAGQVPTPEMLGAVMPEDLGRSWSPAYPDMPEMGHTLLRQAIVSRNVPAAEALIAAGADPFFNAHEMAFLALATPEDRPDGWRYWFADHSTGNAFLSQWIVAGGDVNTSGHAAVSTGPLLTQTAGNLEAILMLLEAGADPWRRDLKRVTSSGTRIYSRSFFLDHANASEISGEIAFRVALLGHYRNGPPEMVDELIFLYDRTAAQYLGTTGPENLHVIWCIQKVLPLILEQTGREPTPAIAALLATPIPEGIGGFWLAPGEIRSPMEPDQRVRSDNQRGRELWSH